MAVSYAAVWANAFRISSKRNARLGVLIERRRAGAGSRPDRRRPARRGNSSPPRGRARARRCRSPRPAPRTASSGFAAASTNGYRLTTTTSTRPMPMTLERGQIVGTIAAGQDAAVERRVQRLHAAVHHLGKAGEVRDARDGQAGVGQGTRRAAGRDELEAAGGEAARPDRRCRSCRKHSAGLLA